MPNIRLPREFRELAGPRADIYQTVRDGKLAFLVVVDKEVDNFVYCHLRPKSPFVLPL